MPYISTHRESYMKAGPPLVERVGPIHTYIHIYIHIYHTYIFRSHFGSRLTVAASRGASSGRLTR